MARVRKKRNLCKILVRQPGGKGLLEYISLDGRVILKWA